MRFDMTETYNRGSTESSVTLCGNTVLSG
uniref:Uncharacterized protein n=1 Tax=Anguilla anguilla TaxID=7936 RepID=A0A0E9SJE6_ANGAN